MKKAYINPKEVGGAPKFYSHAVSVAGPGKLVYVSGQISTAQDGKVIGIGNMAAQAKQVFDNLTHILKAAGGTWNDVIKMNAYMVGMTPENVAAYRQVRMQYLKGRELPASTLVGVTALVHPQFLLEVEVVAALN
jgi:enamine deaminase RidA (YjgF/YER057c/UK114 family)